MTPSREFNADADNALEHQLANLTPRGAPAELRDRVLSQETVDSPNLVNRRQDVGSRIERVLSVSLIALFILGVGLCFVSQRWQSNRLSRVLGPTPAELQAEQLAKREVQKMNPSDDEESLRSIRDKLLVKIQREHESTSTVHSLTHHSFRQSLAVVEPKQ